MNAIRRVASLMLLVVLVVACGSDSPAEPNTGITLADLEGSWIATSVVHTNNADASETFDMIAAGGEVRFTMLAGGGTRTWVEFGTFTDEWDAQASLSGNAITMDPVEAARPTQVWTFTLVNGRLTVTREDSEWDFTLMGEPPVATTEVIVFVRN